MSRIYKINCLAYKLPNQKENEKFRDLGIEIDEEEELKVMPMYIDVNSVEFYTLLEEYSEEKGMTLLEVFLKSGAQITLNIEPEKLQNLINGE